MRAKICSFLILSSLLARVAIAGEEKQHRPKENVITEQAPNQPANVNFWTDFPGKMQGWKINREQSKSDAELLAKYLRISDTEKRNEPLASAPFSETGAEEGSVPIAGGKGAPADRADMLSIDCPVGHVLLGLKTEAGKFSLKQVTDPVLRPTIDVDYKRSCRFLLSPELVEKLSPNSCLDLPVIQLTSGTSFVPTGICLANSSGNCSPVPSEIVLLDTGFLFSKLGLRGDWKSKLGNQYLMVTYSPVIGDHSNLLSSPLAMHPGENLALQSFTDKRLQAFIQRGTGDMFEFVEEHKIADCDMNALACIKKRQRKSPSEGKFYVGTGNRPLSPFVLDLQTKNHAWNVNWTPKGFRQEDHTPNVDLSYEHFFTPTLETFYGNERKKFEHLVALNSEKISSLFFDHIKKRLEAHKAWYEKERGYKKELEGIERILGSDERLRALANKAVQVLETLSVRDDTNEEMHRAWKEALPDSLHPIWFHGGSGALSALPKILQNYQVPRADIVKDLFAHLPTGELQGEPIIDDVYLTTRGEARSHPLDKIIDIGVSPEAIGSRTSALGKPIAPGQPLAWKANWVSFRKLEGWIASQRLSVCFKSMEEKIGTELACRQPGSEALVYWEENYPSLSSFESDLVNLDGNFIESGITQMEFKIRCRYDDRSKSVALSPKQVQKLCTDAGVKLEHGFYIGGRAAVDFK